MARVMAAALCALLAAGCRDAGNSGSRQTALAAKTSSGVDIVLVPGGTFRMGSAYGREDEAPVHEVTLSAFAVDVYEVLQEEYARLQISDPSNFKDPRRPVEQIPWSDAALFCNRRSEEEGLTPCYDEDTFACDFTASGYRLPTEAEWEYACLAGDDRDRPVAGAGGTGDKLASRACYAGNAGKKTAPAGSKRANAWGCYDLLGNVFEWCQDRYAADQYAQGAQSDPTGPQDGKHRVLRGGSWTSKAADCRARRRFHDDPGLADACFARNTYGFRCVRRLTTDEAAKLEAANGDTADGRQ